MQKDLGDGYELDDDPRRIDRAVVHRFLSEDAYWARGRSREVQDALLDGSQRVVGLYRGQELMGFSRTVSDGHVHAYLADVFVLPQARGRGLGVELVRFSVEEGPYAGCRWLLHTEDAHELYSRFGFVPPGGTLLERPRGTRP